MSRPPSTAPEGRERERERQAEGPAAAPELVGRYALHGEIASGGMAVVHYGVQMGAAGFARPVAIKRVLPGLSRDASVRAMFMDEARLAARIRHPNVVPVLDVVSDGVRGGELLIVMEYVHGEPLQTLLRSSRERATPVPLRIVLAIASSVLHGLHAAHEARTETGEPLGIVHRDVSPQNIMVGADGVIRVLDFGIARAARRIESTAEGIVKGKLAYMPPEQLAGTVLDRRADVYSMAVVLWEMLTGRRLFMREDCMSVMIDKLLQGAVDPPSRLAPGVPRLIDAIVLHGLARDPAQRFATAREMALALERAGDMARPSEIGDWVGALATDVLAEREEHLRAIERTSSSIKLAASPETASRRPSLTSDRPTMKPPARTGSAAVITPHQAMAVPVQVPMSQRRTSGRSLGVFFAYMAVGAGMVLTVVTIRTGLRAAATGAAPAAAACADDMVHVSGLCIDATESVAESPAAAASACTSRGKRLPSDAEREAATRGPGAVPPPTPRPGGATGMPYRCVTPW